MNVAASLAGLNVALNFLLIPRFGMMGAAVATLASYLAAFALLYLFAQKIYPIDYKLARMIAAVALSACVMAVGYAVRFEGSPGFDFAFRILLLAGFTLCLLRFFVPRRTEGRTE